MVGRRGVAAYDVDSIELFDGLVDCGADGVFLAGVHFYAEELDVFVGDLQFVDCGLEGFGANVAEGELADSMAGEGVGCVLSDACWGFD